MASELKRGCGYRKVGGLYLCADGYGMECCKLPIPLEVCPTCNGGIKKTRGFQWIDPRPWVQGGCKLDEGQSKWPCILRHNLPKKAGLMWIGAEFYPTVASFNAEAMRMGISRKIRGVPKGFRLKETLVFLAHPKAIWVVESKEGERVNHAATIHPDGVKIGYWVPGIFRIIRPDRFEKIITEAHALDPALMEKLARKGMTPVIVTNDADHRAPPRKKPEMELRI